MPFENRLERLRELLALNEGWYDAFRVRCAAVLHEGKWTNLRCDVIAYPLGVERESSRRHDYRTMLLLEEWMDAAGVVNLLRDASKGSAVIDGTTVTFGDLYEDSQLERHARQPLTFGAPTYRIIFPFSLTAPVPDGPFFVRGLRFYPNGGIAIQDWCDSDGGEPPRYTGTIIVRLPQCRARLGVVEMKGDSLRVTVEGDEATLAGAMIKGAWIEDALKDFEQADLAPGKECTLPVPGKPRGLQLYLVDAANEILDCHIEHTHVEPWRPRVLPNWSDVESDQASIRAGIATGESQTVEFKPFIKPGDPKMREVYETVVAFANTGGGVLAIGVDDYCNIVGIERGLVQLARRKGGLDLTVATNDYIARLRKGITEALSRVPSLRFAPVDLDGHLVIGIFISTGLEKPYSLRASNEVFIRRGPNNVRPDPDHEWPALVQQQRSGSSWTTAR